MAFVFPLDIGLILLFSLIGGLLAVRFKQPSVIGLMIIGMIVGPDNLGLIHDKNLLFLAMEVGAVLLMFTIGVEFSLNKLKKFGFSVILVGALKMGFVFLAGFYGSKLLGLTSMASLFMGAIFMITSTVLFIKILEQKGYAKNEEVAFLVALLILEDIVAIFTLTFFSGFVSSTDLSIFDMVKGLAISFIILFMVFVVLQKAIRPINQWLCKYQSDETMVFFSFGLLVIFAFIAERLHLSPTIGAFFAGNILASLPNSKVLEETMHPFSLFFTSLFFFSVGAYVQLEPLLANIWIIVLLFLILLVSAMVVMTVSTYLFGKFNARQAIFAGLSMATIGEFGLLLATESIGLDLGIDLISIVAGIILLSALGMSILLTFEPKIQKFMEKKGMPMPLQNIKSFIDASVYKLKRQGKQLMAMHLSERNIVHSIIASAVAFGIGLTLWKFVMPATHEALSATSVYTWAIVVLALFVLFNLYRIILNIEQVINIFFDRAIKPLPGDIKSEKKAFGFFIAAGVLFLIMVILPIVAIAYDFSAMSLMYLFFGFVFLIILLSLSYGNLKKAVNKNNALFRKYACQLKLASCEGDNDEKI